MRKLDAYRHPTTKKISSRHSAPDVLRATGSTRSSQPDSSERPAASLRIPQRLHEAIQCVIRETRGFNERKQEAWCRVCHYKDPLGMKLHDPNCSIYELHAAWEDTFTLKDPA